MSKSISIPKRFNGPLESGNGGYSAGLVAGLVEGGAEVSLRSPVPLDTPLEAVAESGSVLVSHGETLVAEGHPAKVDPELPEPVTPDAARAAMAGYRGLRDGPFCHCYVCGLARDDSFRVFAGRVEGRDLVASTWTPPAWTADDSGEVLAEHVWAALDCPTYFAAYLDEDLGMSFLVRFAVRIDAPVVAGSEHIVVAWPIESAGRKRRAGSAVMTADGEPVAVADALLVEPRA